MSPGGLKSRTIQGKVSGRHWSRPLRASNRQEDINVATKLFVGNLAFTTTQTELEQLFGEVGEIGEVFIPMDRDSGRPRGFAFVEFPDAAIAAEAIKKLDGHELGGRALRVNEAQERPPRAPRAPRSFGDDGGRGFDSPKRNKPKGSRKNARARKRGF